MPLWWCESKDQWTGGSMLLLARPAQRLLCGYYSQTLAEVSEIGGSHKSENSQREWGMTTAVSCHGRGEEMAAMLLL